MFHNKQKGFGLPAVLLIISVIAGLVGLVARVSVGNLQTSDLEFRGERARLAARSGLEWAAYQIYQGTGCSGTASFPQAGAGTPLPGFEDLTINVSCQLITTDEGGEARSIYVVESISCSENVCPAVSPGARYVERKIIAQYAK